MCACVNVLIRSKPACPHFYLCFPRSSFFLSRIQCAATKQKLAQRRLSWATPYSFLCDPTIDPKLQDARRSVLFKYSMLIPKFPKEILVHVISVCTCNLVRARMCAFVLACAPT